MCSPSAPRLAGIGLRSAHYKVFGTEKPAVGWVEVHPENYFCGGLHTHMLASVRKDYEVSFHAVGLSLGSSRPVGARYLEHLRSLVERFEPLLISDHASWSASGNAHLNDLLPLPYNHESLASLCRNIEITQEYLKRTILIENPSSYLGFAGTTMSEPDFLAEAVRRTGCGLLLDINNVVVQSHNFGFDAERYMELLPHDAIQEIHLAGHTTRQFENSSLLVDTHNRPVCDEVWSLYRLAINRFGPVLTLVEWDRDLPPLSTLVAEAQMAEAILAETF